MPTPDTAGPARRLSIGEVADLAGVTPRAVRHYHATGALPEPARDGSGYRRYGTADVIALVRVARLRTLGMPISQIVSRVAPKGEQLSLGQSLRELADDLDREIDRLTGIRDRLYELVNAETFEQPAEALVQALRARGLLEPGRDLPPGEYDAANLLDALHPGGVAGVLEQAEGLLDDPDRLRRLGPLIQRFRDLTDESSDADIDGLARDAASALPRPEKPARPVDVDVMDKLVGDRLNGAQRRFMHRLRRLMDTEHG